MKRKILFLILTLVSILCLGFGFAACGNGNNKEKSFKLICPTEMTAGERIEITIEKSYDFDMRHKDYTWSIVGENTVDGSFEFEDLDESDNYTNKFFRAKLPGIVSIQATNTTSGAVTSDIVTITVTANKISTVEELKGLANTNKTVELGADLDLAGENWIPISGFTGTLIGGDYKIKNLTINSVNDSNLGLFGTLKGTVKNLTIENAQITSRGDAGTAGIVAGTNNGRIDGVTVSGTINPLYYNNVGGIVGYNDNGNISGCNNNAAVTGADKVGGIAGNVSVNGNGKINNNVNNGEVSGTDNVGGIAGYLTMPSIESNVTYTVANNTNSNTVKGNNRVGGIFGEVYGMYYNWKYAGNFEMSVLENSAEIIGTGNNVGGLIGYGTRVAKLTVCSNTANISGGNYIGGFVGYSPDTNIQATGQVNNNQITGKGYVGGFAGCAGVIENAINNGAITSTGVIVQDGNSRAYVGGIAGYCTGAIRCTNNVDIKVSNGEFVGGIAGYLNVSSSGRANYNVNNGEVSGTDNVGGIAGYLTMPSIESNVTYTVANNTNSNTVKGNNRVGGIFGEVYGMYYNWKYAGNFEITYCTNEAEIFGNSYVGGIVGYYTRLKTDANLMDTNTTLYGNKLGM